MLNVHHWNKHSMLQPVQSPKLEVPLMSASENAQPSENFGWDLANKTDRNLHCCRCTKNNRKALTGPLSIEQLRPRSSQPMTRDPLPLTMVSTAEILDSSEHSDVEHLLEHFDKRLDALHNEIDELNRQMTYLRQRSANTRQDQQE
ncbi:unnamed protein product [Rotaria sordida]|uniref:Uncharacterized protein n=1 Tax=Rotaria sordida TaxID=392033 RepID=A0A815Y0F2_9BILA|nr:unnamed protein product [Rotaria sordida]CAF1564864.1 unnamed protein product [Rotaria sordida]